MKTKLALAFYYLAIGFLTACACVIVLKLIFWPPCTQTGNTCVVDPWSVAGLAGTILAAAATVLAVLGAVAVAAWWTSLNERVNDQVRKLYSAQKAEVDAQIDHLLQGQQERADRQIAAFQTTIEALRLDMSHVQELTERASNLVQQTYERSEQQATQLQQADVRANDMLERLNYQLGESRRQAGALDGILKSWSNLYQLWAKSSTSDERMKLLQKLLERDAPLSGSSADSPDNNSADTTPTPADRGPASG